MIIFLRQTAAILAMLASPAVAAGNVGSSHVSCKGEPREILVRVVNVKQSVGLMTVELYRNDPAMFLKKEGREARVRFAAKAPVTEVCVYAPAAGPWSMVAYHDENANEKFDKTSFGLPAEPFGLSQDPKLRFAPPAIEQTLFDVDEAGASVEIRLRR